MINKMYKMKLHDVLMPDTKENIKIIRVPGGWIYITYLETTPGIFIHQTSFVPYSMEFKES